MARSFQVSSFGHVVDQVRPDGFSYEPLLPGSTGTTPRDGPPKKYAKIWLKSGAKQMISGPFSGDFLRQFCRIWIFDLAIKRDAAIIVAIPRKNQPLCLEQVWFRSIDFLASNFQHHLWINYSSLVIV